MADNTYNYGFRWHSNLSGGDQPKPIRYRLASAYSAAPGGVQVGIRPGDVVKPATDGTVELAVAGDATIAGVVSHVGPFYNSALAEMDISDHIPYGQGAYSTNLDRETYVYVIPAFGTVFQAMCDDATTATTQAAYTAFIGENADLINAAVTGYAHPLLDISTHATTAAQFRIMDFLKRPGVDFTGNYVPFLVTVNESYLPTFTTTGV
jgi:hypothetical protein